MTSKKKLFPHGICGKYVINGETAFCIERDGIVRVDYENGGFTAFSVATFYQWKPVPLTAANQTREKS